MSGIAARTAVIVPPAGCLVLVLVVLADDGLYRALVREDSLLEWAQVAAYAGAATIAVRVTRQRGGAVAVVYALVALAAVAAAGEELSWGQRLFGIATPEPVAETNRQHELNAHNLAGAESPMRFALLVAAAYGTVAPFVLRAGPCVPPRVLAPAFAVVAGYLAVRFAFLPRPTYAQAKFSEWPELCFAAAVALTTRAALVDRPAAAAACARLPSMSRSTEPR